MSTKLLNIQPKELQFIFELKKQSTCTVQLANNTHHHVAFKVKTTSPKKYCVRPNVGIILPKSTCDFSVIMQAQRAAPPDMLCKDKFLIQSTIVPSGTTEEDITASMFSKDGGKYIEEDKLKVALISPLNSPILSPTDGELDEIMDGIVKPSGKSGPLRDGLATNEIPKPKYQNGASDEMLPSGVSTLRPSNEGMTHEASRLKDDFVASKGGQPIEASKPSDQNGELREEVLLHQTSRLKDQNGISKEEIPREALKPRDQNGSSKEEELTLEAPKKRVQNGALEGQGYETSHLKDPLSSGSVIQPPEYVAGVDKSQELNNSTSRLQKTAEIKQAAESELMTVKKSDRLKLVKDIDEMKSKLNEIELKLGEAQGTISMLSAERRSSAQEVKILKDKMMELSRRGRVRNQVGFPPLFICMVTLICIVLGYVLHH
ncbi:vesicle-associated protein 2-2-like [Momordica charantia]|uniref:Vesicle-associated protein 2-2-like n=1 Tax=Momordica charantia TaxID=3673 RepID=A0A6J1CPY8_MOMCH|nr:vesicle-associated protein 2-2-like [Momordica charantia]XP_022143134.1 vesicle-associated protein 2-2-like [Momordica charantia]